jgi:hypothetical protein
VVDQVPGGLDLGRHVGQHELDALELVDPLPELLALVGVAERLLERALGDAQRERADADAAGVERLHEVDEARPGSPSTFSSGTKASSITSSRVSEARHPILSSFFPARTPSVKSSSSAWPTPSSRASPGRWSAW